MSQERPQERRQERAGTRRKTRAQPQLTKERVRDEALRLIETEGLEEFSTRKLGRALGVEAMAIYWYYPSKDALLDAVVEGLITKLGPPSRTPRDFLEALRGLAYAYRGLAHEHPNAFPLLATRRFATEATYGFLENLFTMAHHFGLDERTTARWYRLVASYCSGIALDELAGMRAGDGSKGAAEKRKDFPRLTSVSAWLAPDHYDDVFAFGLEVLLDALTKSVGAKRAPVGAKKPRGETATKTSPTRKPKKRGARTTRT